MIDYIVSPNNKPTKTLSTDDENFVNQIRQEAAASSTAWNPTETKKYFYDSYKIAISNVDLACGVDPVNSKMKFDLSLENSQTENYIGKTIYSSSYPTLDSSNKKRCSIENLIQNL